MKVLEVRDDPPLMGIVFEKTVGNELIVLDCWRDCEMISAESTRQAM